MNLTSDLCALSLQTIQPLPARIVCVLLLFSTFVYDSKIHRWVRLLYRLNHPADFPMSNRLNLDSVCPLTRAKPSLIFRIVFFYCLQRVAGLLFSQALLLDMKTVLEYIISVWHLILAHFEACIWLTGLSVV